MAQRGRPRKVISYDVEVVKEYVERLFNIEAEIKELQLRKKDLNDEFKDKIQSQLISRIIRLVKAQVALANVDVSDETKSEISDVVTDKINKILVEF